MTKYCPECNSPKIVKTKEKSVSGKIRWRCPKCRFRTTKPLDAPKQLLPKAKKSEIKKHKRFLITSAVNDTALVSEAHETFKYMAKKLGACYLIIPGVYKNPDLKHQGITNQYTWPTEIIPYLCNVDVQLNKNIWIKAESRIQYTAINPLSGMNHAGNIASEIYGHPQMAMEMVPTVKDKLPKMMLTTGSISRKNYGGSKSAKKAEFHHSISAAFIEIKGDKFWPTQVHFDGEGAFLFDKYYTPKSVTKDRPAAAVIYGDTHVRALCPKTEKKLRALSKSLKTEKNIFHDLHDHHIGSHHTEKNTVLKIKHSKAKDFCIRNELDLAVDFLEKQSNPVLVDSNHHRHLNQWFNRFKPHTDTPNVDLYFELGELARNDIEHGGDGDLFRCYLERYCKKDIDFVNGNQSYLIRGIDCSQHGDVGPNGSKGSAKSFSRTGHKTVIGHSHTPRIEKGCYQVGTSTRALEYAVGYSSWMETHCIIYDNGKRGLFNLVSGDLSPLMRTL